MPVYPITPQTPIIQGFANFVADGRAHGELINVESEHSAMSAAIGAALAGARTITATSSQGLALMAEVVYIAAAMRAPIVMAVGNRALSGPDQHPLRPLGLDARSATPASIQLFAENAQEAYDLMVLAPRLAEHPDVLLPVLVCQDGFTITHSAEPVELLDDEVVRDFVGEYRIPHPLLDVAHADDPGAVRDAGLLLRAPPPADRGHARRRSASSTSSRASSRRSRPALPRRRAVPRSTMPSARSSASARRPAR